MLKRGFLSDEESGLFLGFSYDPRETLAVAENFRSCNSGRLKGPVVESRRNCSIFVKSVWGASRRKFQRFGA
jgi:hypothetical protein